MLKLSKKKRDRVCASKIGSSPCCKVVQFTSYLVVLVSRMELASVSCQVLINITTVNAMEESKKQLRKMRSVYKLILKQIFMTV